MTATGIVEMRFYYSSRNRYFRSLITYKDGLDIRLFEIARPVSCENVETKNVRVAESRQNVLLGQPDWC